MAHFFGKILFHDMNSNENSVGYFFKTKEWDNAQSKSLLLLIILI